MGVFYLGLVQLVLDQSDGEPGAVNRGLQLLQGKGQGADMILMAVGDQKPPELFRILFQIGHIRDHQIDARHIVVWEDQAAIHHHHVLAVFDHGEVLADLPYPA